MKGSMLRAALLALVLAAGCSARAGMFCQQDSDCRTGLICVKPVPTGATSDGGSFGICEPARRGQGEVCLWGSECQMPLVCSNTLGQYTGDGRHGRCLMPPPAPDAADPAADLAADAAPAADGSVDAARDGDM